jgi:CubicO group peptidase (beta-lactamase class C family)/D-alanyl-D-alanine dipeptidase
MPRIISPLHALRRTSQLDARRRPLGLSWLGPLLIVLLLALLVLLTPLAAPALAQTPPDYSAAIDRLRAAVQYEVEAKNLPAFSIALVDDQRLVWAEGFGFQDADKQLPATAETVYRVGSVSKLFTDIAIMQCVEQGELDLDADVATYLPDFQPQSPFGQAITLRQLMSHQAGLVREPPVGHYFDPDEPSLAATVASLNTTSLVYPPGARTKYSNAGIAVVGAVLEQGRDQSQVEHVQHRILDPLQMHNSSFIVTPAVAERLAAGWMRTYDGRVFEAPRFLLGTGPAGNLYSSVVDLSRFLSCLFREGQVTGGSILQPATLRQMLEPVKNADGKPLGFGLGFHIQTLDGHTRIGHGGAVYGFSTQLEALPERRLGVAAVAALDGANGVVERLALYALRLMLAEQDGQPLPDYRRTQPVAAERARDLAGSYRHAESGRTVHLSELGGQLFMQHAAVRTELRAAADDGSLITDDALGFGTVVRVSDGKLTIGNMPYQRLPDQPPAEAPERWSGLIGEYGWDHNVLYILEDGGTLYALIEWFFYYPLQELDDNRFAFPDYGLYHGEELHFTRDAAGQATRVVAAEVDFERRPVGLKSGETFRIEPVEPIEPLRARALAAEPPAQPGQYRDSDLVELIELDPTIQLDIRYATTNNFAGAVFYEQPRAFLQRPAAAGLLQAHHQLGQRGLGLRIHDAYRPWHVTKMFWDATPAEFKHFVANPANGSRHNRGAAVDLTLYDRTTGQPIDMVAGYDEFSPRSYPLYPGGTARQRWYRDLLRRTMQAHDFSVYEFEWWHFDHQDWKQYPLGNRSFQELLPK